MADEVKTETTKEPSAPEKKNFFKSTSFKCIIVLLAIVLVCGILLTICNALFYVSDAEKLERSLNTIYGTDVNSEYVYEDDIDNIVLEYKTGTIETTTLEVTEGNTTTKKTIVAFKILSYTSGEAINDYLVKATGTGGYNSGSVTCWIAFTTNSDYSEITGVRSVSIDSNLNQSYISKIKSKNLEYFSNNFTGSDFASQVGTGATFSMGAITNAVNLAMEFVNSTLIGTEDIYANFEYTDYIDKSSTTYEVSGDDVTYTIKTKSNSPANAFEVTITVGADKTITSYEITKNGGTADYFVTNTISTDILKGKTVTELEALLSTTSADSETIATGATRSNTLCVQAALFAVANYDLCITGGVE